MGVIRFTTEGLVNSFRKFETATFQHTELTPKKTHIVGMLTNIMGRNEQFYYNFLPQVKVGIVPLHLENMFLDVWQYKKWKKSNQGRDIVKREKLYRVRYDVYLEVPEYYQEAIFNALKMPRRPPALGMDDELVEIKNVKKINSSIIKEIAMKKITDKKIKLHSTFPEDWVVSYKFSIYRNKKKNLIIPPRIAIANLEFVQKLPRHATEFLRIVEFFGGYCEIEPKRDILWYKDEDRNIVLW